MYISEKIIATPELPLKPCSCINEIGTKEINSFSFSETGIEYSRRSCSHKFFVVSKFQYCEVSIGLSDIFLYIYIYLYLKY